MMKKAEEDAQNQNLSYFSNLRLDVFTALDVDLQQFHSILEVGCGSGATKSLLNKGQSYLGIDKHFERDLEDDQILKADLELPLALNDRKFDLIIINDVLEHLKSPEFLLSQVMNATNVHSRVVVSIPNFLYFDNLFEIITKRDFRYRVEGGILDATHLRFYTRKSILRLLEGAGFLVEKMRPINGYYDKSSRRSRAKELIAKVLTLGYRPIMDDFCCLQWAVLLRR